MLKIFGVRHHGIGCSRALVTALDDYKPDLVLVEGPQDAESVLEYVGDADLLPPVAILIYADDDPSYAGFYPLSCFSPEWITLRYGAATGAEVKFFDLPSSVSFTLKKAKREKEQEEEKENEEQKDKSEEHDEIALDEEQDENKSLAQELLDDPLGTIARHSGIVNFSEWEERAVEQADAPGALFPELIEMCAVARSIVEEDETVKRSYEESLREAHMRRCAREALKSGAERIAVVCGAWHAPVLELENPERKDLIPTKKDDDALLAKLPKMKTTATWIPWTHRRLARASGYGAAIKSPGWFEALWKESEEKALLDRICGVDKKSVSQDEPETNAIARWTTRAARCLRKNGFESLSTAEAIDAARLADSLATMRGRSAPNIEDARDAVFCVFGQCREEIVDVVRNKLEVGESLGTVPQTVPTVPLERDLELQAKKLRLKRTDGDTLVKLDLREESGKKKSAFFHRVNLLNIPWAVLAEDEVRSLGTFRECWTLRWDPEYAVRLVEASRFGATVYDAASNSVVAALEKLKGIGAVLALFEQALNAEIAQHALDALFQRIEKDAALTYDVDELFDAIPPLARLLRYGDSRKSNAERLRTLFDTLYVRLLLALPGSCAYLDEDAAQARNAALDKLTRSIIALDNRDSLTQLCDVYRKTVDDPATSRAVSGKLTRVLFDQSVYDAETLALKFGFFVSTTTEPPDAAQWLGGFLSGPGQTLLWLEPIWRMFDSWLAALDAEAFLELAPILRRSFADFTPPERKEMGRIVARLKPTPQGTEPDPEKASAPATKEEEEETIDALSPVMAFILGTDDSAEKADQKPKDEDDSSDDQFDPLSFILGADDGAKKSAQEPTEPEPKNEKETSDDQFNPLSFILGLDEK